MSWADFNRDKKEPAKIEDIDISLDAIFCTDHGKRVMLWLREKTLETVLSSEVSDSALKEHNGKRHLVHEIEMRLSKIRKKDVREIRADYYKSQSRGQ